MMNDYAIDNYSQSETFDGKLAIKRSNDIVIINMLGISGCTVSQTYNDTFDEITIRYLHTPNNMTILPRPETSLQGEIESSDELEDFLSQFIKE